MGLPLAPSLPWACPSLLLALRLAPSTPLAFGVALFDDLAEADGRLFLPGFIYDYLFPFAHPPFLVSGHVLPPSFPWLWQRDYAPGSADRARLQSALDHMLSSAPFDVPCVIDGKPQTSSSSGAGSLSQPVPHDHTAAPLCTYHPATSAQLATAIDSALAAKPAWEAMPWNDRAAIFLKAADLVAGKYREEIMAATMLGQGKNAWQAEIDAAAEVSNETEHETSDSEASARRVRGESRAAGSECS